ncbi:MAG TPA: hypothetical protein VFL86_20510 [Burkholderiaceae bacterium]|nr:hypothetical protein [Burkholderiaceae bacterium]
MQRWTGVTGVRDSRRGALAVLASLASALAGCSALPFNNPFGPRTIEVSQEQLLAQVSGQFPFNRRMLDFFEVTVSAPRLTMLPQENRVATELDVDTGRTLLTDGFKGRLTLSYGLRYEPSDQSVRLAEVRLDRFELEGVPDALKTRTGRLGSLLAEELLSGFTVYRFKPEDLNRALGLGYKPGGIHVTGRGVALTLEPATRR